MSLLALVRCLLGSHVHGAFVCLCPRYIVFFTAVFPLAPLCQAFNNFLELQVDIMRMAVSTRLLATTSPFAPQVRVGGGGVQRLGRRTRLNGWGERVRPQQTRTRARVGARGKTTEANSQPN